MKNGESIPFGPNTPLMRAMAILADLFIVNLLWLFCCVPIITAGASTAALYTVTLKSAKGVEGEAAKRFWRAFQENFKQGTVITLALLILAVLLIMDYNLYFNLDCVPGFTFIGMTVVASLTVIFLAWAFPYMAEFGDTTLNLCRNCLKLALLNPGKTALMVLMNLTVLGLTALFLLFKVRWILFWVLCAGAGTAFVNSFLVNLAFAPILKAAIPEKPEGYQP